MRILVVGGAGYVGSTSVETFVKAGHHVTVYAKGACESCPIKASHVGSIEPKLRALVGADNIFVHDYFDWFDTQFSVQYGD